MQASKYNSMTFFWFHDARFQIAPFFEIFTWHDQSARNYKQTSDPLTNANEKRSPKWYQRRNQGKWLMGSRCEQVPWSSRWQLPYCASSPVPTCATPLSTLPIHWMPFGRQAAPLGQESIWSSWGTGEHISDASIASDTCPLLPTTHLPTHNSQTLKSHIFNELRT